jgi:hypothetical protein
MNQSPRSANFSASILGLALVFLLTAASAVAQSKIVRPTPQPTPKRTHVATLRASDSSDGSRVAISSDQSLNNYEAYRRGDRFYVKIPAADVPRAEAVRGRGFADVKAQRTGDSTVLSFRLQPGATAHVEQRANKLDVVVTVPGGTPSVAANRSREVSRPITPETNRSSNPSNRVTSSSANPNKSAASKAGSRDGSKGTPKESSTTASNKNSGSQKSSPSSGSSNSNSRDSKGPSSTSNSNSKENNGSNSAANSNSKASPTPTPATSPSPKASPSVKTASPSPNQKSNIANSASPSPSNTNVANQAGTDAWSQMKARAHYWLLLAQLNPIPVITGALILLAIIALLLVQRRRAKATRRVKVAKTKTGPSQPSVAAANESSVAAAESAAASPVTEAAVASTAAAETAEVIPAPVAAAPPTTDEDGRRERVTQVSAEAKKVFDGEQYDQSIVGSNDPETRRLVGAEMLSAMVGRNVERRERAREAFMKHGYFDDATRDLRVAQSENERAAAARRLSFVQDREATPHLVGALQDSSPDVRRAAVEALMDVRDPGAIGPLNSLMQNETDRKVPRNLIQQAIDACATSAPAEATPAAAEVTPGFPSSQALETEREVIEL